jgi:hypothetical protein
MLPSNTSTPTDNLLFLIWPRYGVRYCTLPGFSEKRADLWQVKLVRFSLAPFSFSPIANARDKEHRLRHDLANPMERLRQRHSDKSLLHRGLSRMGRVLKKVRLR